MGNTHGSTAALIKHKWFGSFDWAGLDSGELKSPYKPNVVSKDDVSNFDRFEEEVTPVSYVGYIVRYTLGI